MGEYVQLLRNYLSDNPPEITRCQMQTILDMLHCCYSQQKRTDPQKIRDAFHELDSIIRKLPIKEQDAVFDIACELCVDHQQGGFKDGVLVGFRLFKELTQ